MQRPSIRNAIAAGLLIAAPCLAQVTIANNASSAALPFSSSIGTQINLVNVNPMPAPPVLGSLGYLRRLPGAGNADYILTGYAVNPTSDGSFAQNRPGYTIQFWYAPDNGTTFQYLWGDGANVSPLGGASGGAFRCFANGTNSLNGNVIVRGLANETFTVSSPLLNLSNGWVHLAFRYDATLNTCNWLVNGLVQAATAQVAGAYNWVQGNLSLIGSNMTTSAAGSGGYDDIRVYDWARTDADIAADYATVAFGTGPSGETNIPDRVYWEAELAVLPHNAWVGTNGDATATDVRVITAGTSMAWGGNSPGQPGLPASGLLNFEGMIAGQTPFAPYRRAHREIPPPAISYTTPGIPAVGLGHNFSIPQNPVAFAIPDGIGLHALGVVFFGIPGIPTAYTYGSPDFQFTMPPGVFNHGDLIRLQMVAPDAGYPGGGAGSLQTGFVYSDCQGDTSTPTPGPHARVEARGVGTIQVSGFWRVHNTGSVGISSVQIDLSTSNGGGGTVMNAWNPTSALNSGGMMSAGTSYRKNTHVITGLDFTVAGNTVGGYTEVLTGTSVAGMPGALRFDFTNFTACIDSLIFDCGDATTGSLAGTAANLSGNNAAGATVTVTFTDSTVLVGTMAVDPSDPTASVVDL